MKIQINNKSIDKDVLMQLVAARYPEYTFVQQAKKSFIIRKSSKIGCRVILGRRNLFVISLFPDWVSRFLFSFSIIVFGIILPLIIYFIWFHPALRRFEKEITAYLKTLI
jgi:hypothetical protein